MTIYLDEDYRCHVTQDDAAWRAVETDAFDGACRTYIEGYRYVPEGETWTREDGEAFAGLMLAPWQDSAILDAAQGAYEDALAVLAPEQEAQNAQIAYIGMMTEVL